MKRFSGAQSLKVSLRRRLRVFAAVPALLALTACEVTPEAQEAIDDSFVINPETPVDPGVGAPAHGCFVERFRQPEAVITRNIDILFVIDTSGSIVEERDQIADGIDAFIGALPSEVNYRVAVMLGHGSKTSRIGKLYKKSTEPVVLSSETMTVEEIKAHLKTKMRNPHTDNSTDGGEAGLASLNRGLDEDRIALAKSQGFLRDDAALAVVFVADENDVCAEFPAGVTPVVDTDKIEPKAKKDECVRTAPARVVNGVVITPAHEERITPELVLAKLRAFKGDMPLVTGAVIYNDDAKRPKVGENEIGYGYKEVVDAHGGVIVDMADGAYAEGLSEIGTLATVKMNLSLDFSLTNADVDADTIVSKVDGQEVEHAYDPTLNAVHLASGGTAGSYVDISYCQIEEEEPPLPVGGADTMCLAGSFAPKSQLKVGLSIDPAEGAMSTILAGLASIGVTPTVYTDAEIIAGKPTADGVTVLIVARKIILAALTQQYVDGVRAFIQNGGSVLGEYDGAALMFSNFEEINAAFSGHMAPAFELFDGRSRGGGLLLPVTASTMNVTDSQDPIMAGIGTSIVSSGLRRAFAVDQFDSDWLKVTATFTSVGYANLVPAGTYPAVMKGRCGSGRVVLFTMNHLEAVQTTTNVGIVVHNALQWLIGTTN